MKTMLDLLIRLQELRRTVDRALRNPQLTDGEKSTACCFKGLVRGCLPPEVLVHYDSLKHREPELMRSPEVFAMAVIVSTYRSLPPPGRRKLLAHFQPARAVSVRRTDRRRLRRRTNTRNGQHSMVSA
jgi:hypothetical protein